MNRVPSVSADGSVAKPPDGASRRRLRAVFAADMANFGGLVAVEETRTLNELSTIRRVAMQELAVHGGWLFGMPGDGLFALFESAVSAVRCALFTQLKLAETPKLGGLRLRIGIHMGDVLFQDELPFGETLVIASRLESLAEPGGILVSAAVMEAVAPRISATFEDRGMQDLKHSPRRIGTFGVKTSPQSPLLGASLLPAAPLDRTLRQRRRDILDSTQIDLERSMVSQGFAPNLRTAPAAHVLPAPAAVSRQAVSDADLAELTGILTPFIGPVAKLLVQREAKAGTGLAPLIDRLAACIPSVSDRRSFVTAARGLRA